MRFAGRCSSRVSRGGRSVVSTGLAGGRSGRCWRTRAAWVSAAGVAGAAEAWCVCRGDRRDPGASTRIRRRRVSSATRPGGSSSGCVDELGYVPASKVGAELLFDVISTAYERTSMIVTTNLPFESWTEVLGSERLTGATLDRLTHRCRIIETKGESYRLHDAKRAADPRATGHPSRPATAPPNTPMAEPHPNPAGAHNSSCRLETSPPPPPPEAPNPPDHAAVAPRSPTARAPQPRRRTTKPGTLTTNQSAVVFDDRALLLWMSVHTCKRAAAEDRVQRLHRFRPIPRCYRTAPAALLRGNNNKLSGTGRNRVTTRHVTPFDLWSALPTKALGLHQAGGTRIEVVGDGKIPALLRKYKGLMSYTATMSDPTGTVIAKVAGTERAVSSLLRAKSGGLLVVLPTPLLAREPDEDDEEEGDESEWLPEGAGIR